MGDRKETIERMTEVCNHANDYYSSHTISYIGCTGWEYNLSVILPFGLGGSLCILGTAYKVVGRARNWRQYAMIKERLSSPWTIEIIVWQHSSMAEMVSRVVKEKVLRSCIDWAHRNIKQGQCMKMWWGSSKRGQSNWHQGWDLSHNWLCLSSAVLSWHIYTVVDKQTH